MHQNHFRPTTLSKITKLFSHRNTTPHAHFLPFGVFCKSLSWQLYIAYNTSTVVSWKIDWLCGIHLRLLTTVLCRFRRVVPLAANERQGDRLQSMMSRCVTPTIRHYQLNQAEVLLTEHPKYHIYLMNTKRLWCSGSLMTALL